MAIKIFESSILITNLIPIAFLSSWRSKTKPYHWSSTSLVELNYCSVHFRVLSKSQCEIGAIHLHELWFTSFTCFTQQARFKLFPSYDFLPSVKRNQMWEKYCRKATKCKIFQQPFVLQNFGNKNSLKRIKMWNNKKAFSVAPRKKKKEERRGRKKYLPNDT